MRSALMRLLMVAVWFACVAIFALWLIEVVRHRDQIGAWIVGTSVVCLVTIPVLAARLRSDR